MEADRRLSTDQADIFFVCQWVSDGNEKFSDVSDN